ncbi:hypothetical protein [Nonomuraea sp. NPDC050540]|uniref:hypothetical protein n=1 Tax=Nonomuraea sp. NPDC050540 TaxID=3364367 RepID=UPI0037B5E381
MTYDSTLTEVDVQFVCAVCEGLEVAAPGTEPPCPPICHTCARLTTADLLADRLDGLEVAW